MPTFIFTSPDGQKIKVSGPEGSTQEEAFQIAQNQGVSRETKPPPDTDIPEIGRTEALGRGFAYGALQQPRDVVAAGYANLFGDIPFKEGLQQAKESSLEGRQGEAKEQRPGYFTGGQIGGNIAITALPASYAAGAVGAAAPALASVPVVGNALAKTAQGVAAGKGLLGIPLRGAIEGGISTGITEGDVVPGALGGAAGAALIGGAGKLVKPIADESISAARKGYTSLLQKAGIDDLTPGQLTGNKNLELVESVIGNLPFTANTARKKTEGQLRKFTRAILKEAGVEGDDISPENLDIAKQGFQRAYKELTAGKNIPIDNVALENIAEIEAKQLEKLPTNVKPIIESYIKDIKTAGESITGEAYQQARSQLGQQAKSLRNSDPFTAGVLKKIQRTLDDAAERSLPEEAKGAFRELNKKYGNYKIIEKAAKRVSEDSLEGVLSPSSVLNVAKERGGGPVLDISRAGRSVLADNIPNSGTAQRQFIQALLTGGVGGSVAYGATQDPEAALLAASGLVAGPKIAQYLLNTPAAQKYLTEGAPVARHLATKRAREIAALLGAQSASQVQ